MGTTIAMDRAETKAGNPGGLMLIERLEKLEAAQDANKAAQDADKAAQDALNESRERRILALEQRVETQQWQIYTHQRQIANLQPRSDASVIMLFGEMEAFKRDQGIDYDDDAIIDRNIVVHCPEVRTFLRTFDDDPDAQQYLEPQFRDLFGCASFAVRSLTSHESILELLHIRGRMKRAQPNAGTRKQTRATKRGDSAFYRDVDILIRKLLRLSPYDLNAALGLHGRHSASLARLLDRGRWIV